MKYEKFKIINMIKEFALYADNNLVNFPRKEIELKHKILETIYNLILITYEANSVSNIEHKIQLQEKCIAFVKYLDFLINLCYDKHIINSKKFISFGEKLDNIVRYITAWLNSTINVAK